MMMRLMYVVLMMGGMLVGGVSGREQMYKVPRALAEVLREAETALTQERPEAALAVLQGYEGEDHAMRQLLLGHVYSDLERTTEAEQAYRAALRLQADMKRAGMALAYLLARQEKWGQAAELLGRFLDIEQAGAGQLSLYARAAYELRNYRLCRVLVNKGMVRFPLAEDFRRLDLHLTLLEEDSQAAYTALRERLAAEPGKGAHWRNVAVQFSRMERMSEALAAWAAAVLCDPCDVGRRKGYVSMLLQEGDWFTVVERGKAFFARFDERDDMELAELFIRAAEMGEREALLRGWLGKIPREKYTNVMAAAEVRSAMRRGDTGAAREGLRRLIAMGEVDYRVYLMAGQLAEEENEAIEAQVMYKQAVKMEESGAEIGWLYLARQAISQEQYRRAKQYIEKYLYRYPDDPTARNLMLLIQEHIARTP